MDPARILQIITNSTWMVTKLVGSGPVEFDKSQYAVEILENTNQEVLLQLRARVQPQVKGPVEFQITGGNEDGYFTLDRPSGRLLLNAPLDYEESEQYNLVVEVRAGEATSEAQVKVRVINVNDNPPAFPRELHETQITEEDDRHLPKTILTQVTAMDRDGGEYGRLRYSLMGDGVYNNGTKSCFSIDEDTGAIHLLKPLDRDPPDGRSKWRLRVKVTDGEFNAYTAVHVNLKDINDNPPYFPVSAINATIFENSLQGASVAQVTARDNDDPQEANNARLIYSLEKNVIDEASGRPIFAVDSSSGLITTALCCLDREKTQWYAIQVVATDGGGLKGTGSVLVEVADVNDVPPKFSTSDWNLDVSERLAPDNVLGTLTVDDQDMSNNFSFRVVPGSGRGWKMFRVIPRGNGTPEGDLLAVVPLDYENSDHRRGFRFKVQVSDMGDEGWKDTYHVDSAWVNLNLVDSNDNAPIFIEDYAQLVLPEDTPRGTVLVSFNAHDDDGVKEGKRDVKYSIAPTSDPAGIFGVDESGTVRLVDEMDRETTDTHRVLVLATDRGTPPRTTTATLVVSVTDINDNPPFLSEPREVQVFENAKPQVVAKVKMDDPDDWRQGHGPPFTIELDPRAPAHISSDVEVRHERRGDEGRGIGIVSTRTSLDREERRALLIPLVVGDAGSPPVTATVTLTLHVADLNDNPMAPASKVITVHTVQPQTTPVPLGRIYVEDPDDWDAASKTYEWKDYQHPNFLLNTKTGDLSMKPATRDGSYKLSFSVSDSSQGQSGVSANVTVKVKSLNHREVESSTPITLAVDPYMMVREIKNDANLLQQLVSTVREWVSSSSEKDVQVVSVQQVKGPPTPSTRLWITSPEYNNLHHIFLHRKQELEHLMGVNVVNIGLGTCKENSHEKSTLCTEGCVAKASLGDGFSVIDANTSSIVGPWVSVQNGCSCGRTPAIVHKRCKSDICLNGGQCVPTNKGVRCICPNGTTGSRCKILTRHFEGGGRGMTGSDDGGGDEGGPPGGGWAWISSIPSCSEVHISLDFFTTSEDATILYSGPAYHSISATATASSRDAFALVLLRSNPSLLLDLGNGATTLSLNASYPLSDSTWHRIDVIWRDELVEMIVDLCSGTSIDGSPIDPILDTSTTPTATPEDLPESHTCRATARLPRGARLLNVAQPLQLGGLSHPPPSLPLYSLLSPALGQSLKGCLRNLRINGELIDLGHNILSQRSAPGCPAVDCAASGLKCGVHGRCSGSPGHLKCECQPGWSSIQCATPTTPAAFQINSYVKLALSFTPLAYTTTIHLRFRTWKRRGELVVLSSQHGRDKLALELMNGRLCLVLQLHPEPARSLCLTQAQLTDGRWHALAAARYGSATFLSADDGEGVLYNASVSFEGRQLLEVDKQEGVHVGGSPEYVGISVFKIHGDFRDGCIDDIRISGKSVPLPPAVNGTPWGQASMFKEVDRGCRAPPACNNVSCRAPLTCVDTWRSYHCGCGEGRVISASGTECQDEDECVWEPCLNGGSCFNKQSAVGYVCACPSGFSGQHCHLKDAEDTSLKLSLGALVAIVAWCTFLLLLICTFLLHQHYRRSSLRRGGGMADVRESNMISCKEQSSSSCTNSHTPSLLELKLFKQPKANGQPAWNKNPSIADVDVLQIDASSMTSSVEDQQKYSADGSNDITTSSLMKNGGTNSNHEARDVTSENEASKGEGGKGVMASGDDLRNYAYEGDGSSPGSLSSCLESCSGSAKFLGGFCEVANILEA